MKSMIACIGVPGVKTSQIKLAQTYTNEFAKKANAKYR